MSDKKISIQNNQRTDVFVVNNAGLFGLYTALKLGQLAHSTVILAYPGYWLDSSHQMHDNNLWGQTPLSLPPAIQELFFSLYSDHEPAARMTWLQYKTLRHSLLYKIAAYDQVLLFRGRLSVQQTEPALEITIEGITNKSLSIMGPTRFHYWLHEPRANALGLGEPTPLFKLYYKSPHDIPNPLCILGAGLSTAWAVRDFNSTIISFHLPNDPQIVSSANAEIDMSRLHRLPVIRSRMSHINNNTISYCPTENPPLPSELICPLYDAIGLVPTSPPKKILSQSIGWSWGAVGLCDWVAPKDTPVGSMLHSYSVLAHYTHNYGSWLGQYSGQYCANVFEPQFLKRLDAHGIKLTATFFSDLQSRIRTLERGLNKSALLNLYLNSYNASEQNRHHFPQFLNFLRQHPVPSFSSRGSVINLIATMSEISSCRQLKMLDVICKSEERFIIQYIRAYFETHLAYSLGHYPAVLQSTKKIAVVVHRLMHQHKPLIIGMIKNNPMFQLTIYSDEKFARFDESLDYCLSAETLFQQFQKVLKDAQDPFTLVHLICMFSFRILPLLEADTRKKHFDALLSQFESNATFRSNTSRLSKNYISREALIKSFFGLTTSDLPPVPPHLPSMGKFYTEDAVYLSTMNQFGNSFVTGYSGHTSRLLSLVISHGSLTKEEQQLFTAAAFAYLAGGGNHNFHEVYSVAKLFGLPFVEGSYKEALPKDYIESDSYSEVENQLKIKLDELARHYPQYAVTIRRAGIAYFGFISSANVTHSVNIPTTQFAVPPQYLRFITDPKDHPVYERGAWDNVPTYHQPSGLPIFTYRAYNAELEVGAISLYARPNICFSNDGQFNNTIKMTGVFNKPNYQHALVDSCEEDISLFRRSTDHSAINQDQLLASTVLSSAVINGALLTAVPEAIGDLFLLSGRVTAQRAEQIKWWASTWLTLLTGSWTGAIASWATTHTLTSVGVCEPKARIAGNAVGFFINTSRSLTTPLGVAATTAHVASGRFGLWAEKKIVRALTGKCQENFSGAGPALSGQ